MEQRYSLCSTASGTRSHHYFVPQSKSTLAMKTLSSDEDGAKGKLYNDDNVTQFGRMSSYIKIYNLENMLLACIIEYGTLVL